MVENETLAIAARLVQLHEQFKEVEEFFQISLKSRRPVLTASALECFEKELSKTTGNFKPYSQLGDRAFAEFDACWPTNVAKFVL